MQCDCEFHHSFNKLHGRLTFAMHLLNDVNCNFTSVYRMLNENEWKFKKTPLRYRGYMVVIGV